MPPEPVKYVLYLYQKEVYSAAILRYGELRMSSQASAAAAQSAGSEPPTFFPDPAIDRLTTAVLRLAGEVWVLTERLAAVEALAARRGLALEEELASFRFSPEEDATLQAAREQFVRTVVEPLTAVGS